MVDQDCFFLPTSSCSRINSSYINMMERGGSWKPNVELSPACPRCGSSNTKFCYYNNYSLTQPRYFCKGCRRYWTKGGSLRNVPIGGGCRKSQRTNTKPPSPPPIRVPSSALSVRTVNGNVVVPSPLGLVYVARQSRSANSTSTSQGTPSSGGPNIDLAAVYANFLNPNNPQPALETASYQHHRQHLHQQHHEIIHQLPNDSIIVDNSPGPSFEFLGAQNNLHLDLTAPHQQDGSLTTYDDNYVAYQSGRLDSSHRHHHLFTNVNTINIFSRNISSNSYVLPLMPDEEELLVGSEDMAWPSINNYAADIMLPSRLILEVNQSSAPPSVVQPQGQNCQRPSTDNDNEINSLINISSFEDFFKT